MVPNFRVGAQSLARYGDPLFVRGVNIDPSLVDFDFLTPQRFWPIRDNRAANHLLGRPRSRFLRIESKKQVHTVVYYRKPTDGRGEVLRQSLQPVLDPLFTMLDPLTAEKRATSTATATIAVTSYFNVHQPTSSYDHRTILHTTGVSHSMAPVSEGPE